MDSTNTSTVTDDQELAQVLENMNQQVESTAPASPTTDDTAQTPIVDAPQNDGLTFEETPPAPVVEEPAPTETPVVEPLAPTVEPSVAPASDTVSPELDAIKKTALEELRPLVDKLDLPADEKFDTLLLLIRSTDDKTLVAAAHEAARGISDEAKRAQALLDVIKEIDYFSGHGQQPA